jgi:enterochelin esterase family protein
MEGSGPVSELRMPDYVPPEITIPRDDIQHGTLGDDITVFSDSLGYHVNYRVYTPFGYEDMQNLPVIYVTDGQDYAHDDLGAMVIVLDNLIADGAIEPVIAVFIDSRDPETGKNRREREFTANEYHDTFLTTELVPAIDAAYRTSLSPDARAILGSSNGGLHSAYVGLKHSDVFHLIAMQSPCFTR